MLRWLCASIDTTSQVARTYLWRGNYRSIVSTFRGCNSKSMSTGLKSGKPKFTLAPTAKIFENSNLNPNLFRFTTAIAGLQCALWCYLSYFALTQLKPLQEMVPDSTEKDGNKTSESSMSKIRSEVFESLMSSKWRLSLSLLSLGAGSMFALVAYIYPLRLVRVLTYVRPTQTLRVVTHSPWGSARELEVPLLDVTCNTTPSQIAQGHSAALKIKDYSLFFMLNHKGIDIDPILQSLVLNRKNV